MRMQKLVLILVMLAFAGNLFAQSGWVKQNPFLEQTLNCTFFINESIGWAAGEAGTVKLTTNGGNNWVTKIPDASMRIISIYFLNSLTGFITGSGGKIYKTTDGGNNWVNLPLGLTGTINQILFTDASTGYICGNSNVIMRTTNAGNNWVMQTIPSANDYYAMSFLNNNTGWISTMHNAMYKTTDGGQNWTSLSNTNVYQIKVRSIQFLNENTGWVFGDNGSPFVYGMLTRTTNGGSSWTVQSLPSYFGHYTAYGNIFFLNDQTGYACGSYNALWRTTNSGENWVNSPMYNNGSLNSIFMFQNQKGFAVGTNGTIIKTADGINWSFVHNGYESNQFDAKYFLNVNTGWFSGDNYVYATTNSGSNWRKYNLGNEPISSTSSLWFMNENTGLICGTQASYYFFKKSSDGGKTWQDVNAGFFPTDFYFINNVTGYAAGTVLKKTTNSGLNWFTEANQEVKGIFYLGESNGWGYNNNTLLKQIMKFSGGNNWTTISTVNSPILSIYFANSNIGWLSTSSGFLKTTNGGLNWESSSMFAFQFMNANTGWAVDGTGKLYKTTTGGTDWQQLNTQLPDTYFLKQVIFIDELTGWITFNNANIYKTVNGGVSIKQISSEIPGQFILHQNYPNPFNPNTVIRYQLSIAGFTSLKVFDLLGKEVAMLVNEKQNAGSYAVDFNSTEYNLPSGIYFYTLNAGEFKETKKMVLIK